MSIKFTEEDIMEKDLIRQLTQGISQWTYREDLNNEEKLWANFKKILESNNLNVLNDVMLTEQEFSQIKNQLNFSSFYEAARWLVGENGIAKVEVQREDARFGKIRLNVLNRADIAGGSSVYEIINQFRSPVDYETGQKTRFDVSLLINGIPLIHIELKSRRTSFMDGFHQIKRYLAEGRFTGIFSAIQMFVITNGTDTRYIAAASDTKLNATFLSRWVDENNNPIDNYIDFAKEVLSIPEAHQMVTQYTVLDNNSKALILLRPYQIHAINAIRDAMRERKSGYVWHTTGSGKTLTSYKVAKNLLTIPSLDKTIFIVDRIDLDQQTTSSFTSYAESDTVIIDETDSVKDLIEKLLSDDRTVTVTTIQKLNYVMKRAEEKPEDRRFKKLIDLNLAFVVDECHRAISAEKHAEINKFFPNSLWYGFTGTPIFAENAKESPGDLPRTTEEQYGKRLHEYTVKEAIHDKAVLGFQIEYLSTLSKDAIDDIVVMQNPKADVYQMEEIDKESKIHSSYYEDDEHMLRVIDTIINKSRGKFGLNKGVGKSYSAILTTSSIPKAQRYYELFREVIEGKRDVKVSEKTKSLSYDFPKVAITYSIPENKELSLDMRDKMAECIKDYNQMFGTNYDLGTIKAYNLNLNERIARKKDLYLRRSEQLDIVIVVDRLLTGFDAPCLSLLFIDRSPMTPHGLIQAFSRTNRLFDKDKRYGQIVTFQTPYQYEQAVIEALVLYSNGGENFIQAPSWQETFESFKEAIKNLKDIAPTPESTNELTSNEEKLKFLKSFQEFDKNFSSIQVYSEFDLDELEAEYGIAMDEIEEYHGKYENIKKEVVETEDPVEAIEIIDIEYEISSLKTQEIDYDYIVMLIQTYVPQKEESKEEAMIRRKEKDIAGVYKYIEDLAKTNPKVAVILEEVFEDVLANPDKYEDKQISNVIQERQDFERKAKIDEFSKKWQLNPKDLEFVAEHYNPSKESVQRGEKELINNGDLDKYNEINDERINKIKYNRSIRKEYKKFVEEEILPYRIR